MQFSIAMGRLSTLPSGRPRIARKWFSNCEVSEPSIVQCPSCARVGAISFATSAPPATKKLHCKHANVLELSQQTCNMLFRRMLQGRIGVGNERHAQDAVTMEVLYQRIKYDVTAPVACGNQRHFRVESAPCPLGCTAPRRRTPKLLPRRSRTPCGTGLFRHSPCGAFSKWQAAPALR